MNKENDTPSRALLNYSIFTTEAGQEVVENLKKLFGFDAPAFVPDATGTYDTHKAAIRDGQRQVILHIESFAKKSLHEIPKKKTARKD